MLKSLKGNKGFTLIELIIVVVILGILILIVLAATRGDRNKALGAQIRSDVARIQTALEDCREANNGYPASAAMATNTCIVGKFDSMPDASHYTYTSTSTDAYTLQTAGMPTGQTGTTLTNKQ